MNSATAWPLLRNGWSPWRSNLAEQGNALQKELRGVNPEEFADELATELLSRTNKFLQGIETYRSHSFTRDLTSPASIWQSGSVQLLDYGETDPTGRNGRPVLVIPSLINRSYIMDLTAECSFLRYLASQGLRPLLVDWGQPDKKSLAQTLDDCVAKTLRNALNFTVDLFMQKPVPIIGYCMGGTLATALSVLEPEKCDGLVLLAAPWDFHAGDNGLTSAITNARSSLERIISLFGYLPVDVIQTMFFYLDPSLGWNKFREFSELNPNSREAANFVALEDWLNDGVPLAAEIARTCLFEWYKANSPARGRWQIAGKAIDPTRISFRTLGVIPANDRIVHPNSAKALLSAISSADTLTPAAGHIGMMVGHNSRMAVWKPIAKWIHERCAPQ